MDDQEDKRNEPEEGPPSGSDTASDSSPAEAKAVDSSESSESAAVEEGGNEAGEPEAKDEKPQSETVEAKAAQSSDAATLDAKPTAAETAGVEPDEPPNTAIFALLAGLTFIVAIAAIGLWQVFGLTTSAEIDAKDLTVDSKELLELRARDWGQLTQYESLDGGGFQIPIERAMDKLVAHPVLIASLVQPATQDAGVAEEAAADDASGDATSEAGVETEPATPASNSSGVSPPPPAPAASETSVRTPPVAPAASP